MGYGPIETIISNLHKGLDSLGHHSTVACSADSVVGGTKYSTISRSLGDYCREGTAEAQATVALHLSKALARIRQGDVDIVHMHEWWEFVQDGRFESPVPIVMTLHVPARENGLYTQRPRFETARSGSPIHFVAISDFQGRQYADRVPIARTVLHGVDTESYPFRKEADAAKYLFSIARITRVKGQDTAIEVARRTGSKLIVAGCVQNKADDRAFFEELKRSVDLVLDVGKEPVDDDYYGRVMAPILSCDKQVIYIGELDTDAKKQWYRRAKATLFPVRWGEPFGMVLIESMACGTPVLAFGQGAVPEIVTHGETGFVVSSVARMVEAVGMIGRIDRRQCRRDVVARFSLETMSRGYAGLYQSLLDAPFKPKTAAHVPTAVRPEMVLSDQTA